MFVGRDDEIAELQRLYQSGRFEMPVIYGRRRVGKTRIITEFLRDKRGVYFQARNTNAQANLALLSQAILAFAAGSATGSAAGVAAGATAGAGNAMFFSYDEAFDAVFELSHEQRFVLAIDEYPYLAQSFPEISSLLQQMIDHRFKESSQLMLILCGSSLSFMEEQVLGYASPLYGRRTAQFKVEPLDFFTTRFFWPAMPAEDAALLYGCTGGIPAYIEKIDPDKDVRSNIAGLFLTPSGYLYEEPSNLLLQECRNPAQYDAIIQAIASGRSRLSEIASATKIPESNTKMYLDRLATLGIVERRLPLWDTSNKRAVYRLKDPMFRFWYRFVPQNAGLVQVGLGAAAYGRIEPHLSEYMGPVFEGICGQYVIRQARTYADSLRPLPVTVGSWWGNDPRTRSQEEIDIVVDDGEGRTLFAECKWRNQPTDADVLERLVFRSELFDQTLREYEVFSKSAFTEACRAQAQEMGNARLTTFQEMCAEA